MACSPTRPCADCLPLIWAESVTADGRFALRAEKRSHLPWLRIRGRNDQWLVIREPCVPVQRTTAKEQARRLIAAQLPANLIQRHGGVVVENHLNMIRSRTDEPVVNATILTEVLNSSVADRLFRCISGSVAVSAFELDALPLPDPKRLSRLRALVAQEALRAAIDAERTRVFTEASE